MLNIFIGFDSREPIAYQVLAHSIMRRSSVPVSITPLIQSQLRQREIYQRERNPLESTEFSLTRFLVPHLSEHSGKSLFMDCDMLCLVDIAELFSLLPEHGEHSVMVCKHEYTPKSNLKFLSQAQTTYKKKNWSSLILFNNPALFFRLGASDVNRLTPMELHQFAWIGDEEVGSLPLEWNWLVGEYEPNPNAKILHYTNGGPWFERTQYADLWVREYRDMIAPMESQDKRYLVGAS